MLKCATEEANAPVVLEPKPNPVEAVVVGAAPKAGAERPGTTMTIITQVLIFVGRKKVKIKNSFDSGKR